MSDRLPTRLWLGNVSLLMDILRPQKRCATSRRLHHERVRDKARRDIRHFRRRKLPGLDAPERGHAAAEISVVHGMDHVHCGASLEALSYSVGSLVSMGQ